MTDQELQLRLLYAVIVAGKSAKFAEQAMARLFVGLGDELPFHRIRVWFCNGYLDYRLRMAKVGNYGKVFKAFHQVAFADLDLRTCSPDQLETIHGVGPKTARFFIIWTRPDARVAALDVHILRWLRQLGYDAPSQTPQGKKYAELEAVFLVEAEKRGMTPRQLDESIWSAGANRDQGQIFDSLANLVKRGSPRTIPRNKEMGIEIERKFLVNQLWRDLVPKYLVEITQGYLATAENTTVRVRLSERKGKVEAKLTVKGPSSGLLRPEFEYQIPVHDAEEILKLCGKRIVKKVRLVVPSSRDGLVWEVDVFKGKHEGLVLAEVELDKPNRRVRLPKWVAQDVSGDSRYSSLSLAIHGLRLLGKQV